MVAQAASPVDVTLTPSKVKVKVKVTEHLNFQQVPITAHFWVYFLRHLLVVITWHLDYSLSKPDF